VRGLLGRVRRQQRLPPVPRPAVRIRSSDSPHSIMFLFDLLRIGY
jgi:hypothetical protein